MTTLEIILLVLVVWFYLAGVVLTWKIYEPYTLLELMMVIFWPASVMIGFLVVCYANLKYMIKFRH